MNCSVNKWLKLICYVYMIVFVASCDFGCRQRNKAKLHMPSIYYNWQALRCGYGLQYVILTNDSLYVNVLQKRDSALVNINRWCQPYAYVRLRNFVPIGIQWMDMVSYI